MPWPFSISRPALGGSAGLPWPQQQVWITKCLRDDQGWANLHEPVAYLKWFCLFQAGKDWNTLANVNSIYSISDYLWFFLCCKPWCPEENPCMASATTALAPPSFELEMIPNPPVWPSPPVWHLSRRTCQALLLTIARPQGSSHDWDIVMKLGVIILWVLKLLNISLVWANFKI